MNKDSKLDSSAGTQVPPQAPQEEADPRWVNLRPSCLAIGITAVAAAAALAVILLTPLPIWLRGFFLLFWVVASYIEFSAAALMPKRAVVAFALRDADPMPEMSDTTDSPGSPLKLDLRLRGVKTLAAAPEIHDATVLYGGVVTPWFTTLKYRLPDDAKWRRWWPRVVPVWSDAIDAEAFRKLRVALKWK